MRKIHGFLLYISEAYWKFNWKNVGNDFLQVLGATWMLVAMSSHFVPQIAKITRGNWKLFFVCIALGALQALLRTQPSSPFRYRLNGRDVWIEIRVANIFDITDTNSAYIISTNTTFDASISRELISPQSLQGQFTEKYYDNEEHLESDLQKELAARTPAMTLKGDRKGNRERHEIGTVVRLCPRNRAVYLVAIAHMNEKGQAYSSFEEVVEGLARLWNDIAELGELEPLVVPVLGTGLARIVNVTREEMIRELIKSFVAACSENKFTEKLTIVVSREDYREHKIDFPELGTYLRHICQYTDISVNTDTANGKAIT